MKASLATVWLTILLPTFLSAQSDLATGESQWIDLQIDGSVADPCCINNAGQVAGEYEDSNQVLHNFLRNPDGTYVIFDIPGANYTESDAINANGTIAGLYMDISGQNYVFLRNPDGSLTTFQPPGTCAFYCEPRPIALTDSGVVIGAVIYGELEDDLIFVRHSDGTIDSFDPNALFGTTAVFPDSGNNSGAIAGTAGNQFLYAFVLKPSGSIETLEQLYEKLDIETYNVVINDGNILTGVYTIPGQVTENGFIKQPGGPLVLFGYPGAIKTVPAAINSDGIIAGTYYVPTTNLGFLRDLKGKIVSVNFPNAFSTSITGINDNGWIIGGYDPEDDNPRTYLRIPGRSR